MNPGEYNINHIQNATYTESFTKKDSAGVPIDISTSTFKMEVRDCDNNIIFTFTSPTEITLPGDTGKIEFDVPSSTFLAQSADVYTQDLVETLSGGDTFTWFRGDFELIEATTE